MPKIRSTRRKSLRKKSARKSSKRNSRKRTIRRKSRQTRRRKSIRKSRRKPSKRKSRSAKRSIKRKNFKPTLKGWYIITKEGCPYCKDAKNLLDNKGQKYKSINMTSSNREKIYKDIDLLTKNYRYVPMVFKDGKFIGGFSELKTFI